VSVAAEPSTDDTGPTRRVQPPRLVARLLRSGLADRAVVLFGLLALWQILPGLLQINKLLFPDFGSVLASLVTDLRTGELETYTARSLETLLIGMGIGVGLAIVLAAAALLSRRGKAVLDVLTSTMNPLPGIALLPVAILWFGLTVNSIIFIIVHTVLWGMALQTYTGFATVSRTTVRVGQNLGLNGVAQIIHISIPAAFPHILNGLRVSWGYSWRAVIAGELVFGVAGSQAGLGWFIYQAHYQLNTSETFAGLVVIVLIGLLVENLIFRVVEDRTVRRWGMSI